MNISTDEFISIASTQVKLEEITSLIEQLKKANDLSRRETALIGAIAELIRAQNTLLTRLANCR